MADSKQQRDMEPEQPRRRSQTEVRERMQQRAQRRELAQQQSQSRTRGLRSANNGNRMQEDAAAQTRQPASQAHMPEPRAHASEAQQRQAAKRTRKTATVDQPRPKNKKPQSGKFIVAAIAVLLVACIGGGAWLVISNSATAEDTAAANTNVRQPLSAAEGYVDKPAEAHQNKLEGAKETVDVNGIVHGTTADGINYMVFGRGEAGRYAGKITLAALGDVLITDNNMPIIDGYAGGYGDDVYDCRPYYQATASQARDFDIRFINQETITAGTDRGFGYSGYPSFNSPETILHSIAAEGFNVVNLNSNHTWDMGEVGIEYTHELWDGYPQVMLIGSYDSYEDRDTVRMIERNGTTFAFLSYCYGDNYYGTDPDNFPNTYYSSPFDDDKMDEEIARAKKVADAVIVYMHWGSEYIWQPNEQQEDYARWLADRGVDLIIGSHAHILQPIKYVTGESGNQVLCIYGLSDFISGWTLTDTIISGMFTCDWVWQEDGTLALEDPKFYPAIEWSDGGEVYVRFLKDMTDEEIASNTRTEDVSDDLGYLHQYLTDLEMDIPIVWD